MSDRDGNVVRLPRSTPTIELASKVCCRCGVLKPLSEFGRDPHVKSGLRGACKKCRNRENNEYRQHNLDAARAATKASRLKKLDYYRRQTQEYKKAHPEKVSGQNKRYRQTEHGRARVAALMSAWRARRRGVPGTYTEDEWAAQIQRQGNRCYYCRRRFCKKRPATKDHLIPLLLGGPHSATNIVAACKSCNSSKKAKRTVLL